MIFNLKIGRNAPKAGTKTNGVAICAVGAGAVATGLIAGVVAFAPAKWAASLVGAVTANQVRLVQTKGTIWSGSGVVLLGNKAASMGALPGRMVWRTKLFSGGLTRPVSLRLQHDCCTKEGVRVHINPVTGSYLLEDSQLTLPLSVLAAFNSAANSAGVSGQVVLSTRNASGWAWGQGHPLASGAVQIEARQVGALITAGRSMGSYVTQVQAVEGGLANREKYAILNTRTETGEVQITGNGFLGRQGWGFKGAAKVAPEQKQAWLGVLTLLGKAQADGTYNLTY